MFRNRQGWWHLVAWLVASFCALTATASDWTGAEQQLAQKIIAITGPGAISIEVVNRSSLTQKEEDEIARGLRGELTARGAQLVKVEQAAATVKVSLSENLHNYVWVGEIRQGGEESVALVALARPDGALYIHAAAPLIIRKIPLWSQAERILDVISLDENGTPGHLVVLTAEQLEIYKFENGRYEQEQALAIRHSRPWPRDLRGRLLLSKQHLFEAYLPGTFCQSTASLPLMLNCHSSDDPWPLGTGDSGQSAFFSATRNFFPGVLSPGIGEQKSSAAFYSAAALPRDKYTLWLFTGVDGQVHLLDGVNEQTANFGWGSGIAAVKTGCGGGWQVLATSAAEDANDSVRAFEFADRDPAPVAQAVEFDGRITAFWPEAGGSTAIAIAKHADTGKYEAFRLAISCSL